ncbi:hypothetical protein [Streptomyces sp. NPDC057336]
MLTEALTSEADWRLSLPRTGHGRIAAPLLVVDGGRDVVPA